MELTVGVVTPDVTLDRLLDRCSILPEYLHRGLSPRIFVAVPPQMGRESEVVAKLNAQQNLVRFEGVSQLSWRTHCDVIVDTVWPAGRAQVEAQYGAFPGVILLEDGASPEGRLLVPPLPAHNTEIGEKKYRMGDCMLSGLVPLLWPFRDIAARFRIHMLLQYDGREPDYLITERAQAWYNRDDLRAKLCRELAVIFPSQDIEIEAVLQIPSLLHYEATVHIEMHHPVAREQLASCWEGLTRVRLLPPRVTSLYDLNLARAFCDTVPPITVFTSAFDPPLGRPSRIVRLIAALYYRTAAVLPNLDAIRILATGMDPLEAMRQTDKDMGFTQS